MNVRNKWWDNITAKVAGEVRQINVEEVQCAMNNMKNGKASKLSGLPQKC